jgi:hypothetical protein
MTALQVPLYPLREGRITPRNVISQNAACTREAAIIANSGSTELQITVTVNYAAVLAQEEEVTLKQG